MPQATVLYVEDEPYDVMFMRRAFKHAGLGEALRVVEDGREAMDYLAGTGAFEDRREHPLPSLVLLDLNLPIVSGFEVLSWMRGQPAFQALPVVVFSSSTREEDKMKARELGASEYLEKPGSALDFPTIVEQLKVKWMVNHQNCD